jgi:hypothetical protein
MLSRRLFGVELRRRNGYAIKYRTKMMVVYNALKMLRNGFMTARYPWDKC